MNAWSEAVKKKQSRWQNGQRKKAMQRRGFASWCPECNRLYDERRASKNR